MEKEIKKILYLLPLLFMLLACSAQPAATQDVSSIVNATLQNDPQVTAQQATFTPSPTLAQPIIPAPVVVQTQPVIVQVQPTAIPQVEQQFSNLTLSLDILRNAAYHSPDWGEFQLSNGIYYRTPPNLQESPEAYTTRLLDTVLYGDINLDGSQDAVVFLGTQNGGTGHFVEMSVVLNFNGSPSNISTLYLGDRVIIESGAIQNGLIGLNMRVPGPNDPLLSPDRKSTRLNSSH